MSNFIEIEVNTSRGPVVRLLNLAHIVWVELDGTLAVSCGGKIVNLSTAKSYAQVKKLLTEQ